MASDMRIGAGRIGSRMAGMNGGEPPDLRDLSARDQIELPSTEFVIETERSVVGTLLAFPQERSAVEDIAAGADFFSMPLGAAFEAILASTAPLPTIRDVCFELERRKRLAMVGGASALSELMHAVATSANLVHEARQVRHFARIRRIQGLHARAAAGEPFSQVEIERLSAEIRGTATGEPTIEHPVGFVGDSLAALRERPEPTSPLPGFLDPEPGLHVAVGQSSTGKTTLVSWLAMCWGCGVAPWEGAPVLPGTRALIVSREQNVLRIDRRCRQLDLCARNIEREAWTGRVSIVARDPMLPRPLLPLLRLDDGGLEVLRRVLQAARDAGDPYGFALLDSLSRLKPADCEENSNDDMTRWLDALEEIAETFGIYLVLLHHRHKMEGGSARTAARGASAIDAVAQGTWLLEAGDEPHVRRLKVHGNALDERTHEFEVASENDPGKILFWRPRAELGLRPIEPVMAVGESVSLSVLGERLFPDRMDERGRLKTQARDLAKRTAYAWERAGWVEIQPPYKKGSGATVRRIGPVGKSVATDTPQMGEAEWDTRL